MKAILNSPAQPRYRHLWLPVAWIVGALLVLWGRSSGPFDPAGRRYGMNWPGDVANMLEVLSVEVLLLYLILRPWSYRRSWGRAAIAFFLFAGWTILGGIGTMHSGRIGTFHWGWLLLVTVGLLGATVVSAAMAAQSHRRAA